VPLPNKMDQEVASAINIALVHQQAPAHITSMIEWRNAMGTITAITQQNATAEMALRYRDFRFTAARTVDKGVVDVKENKSSGRLNILAVPLVQYMRKGTKGLRKIPHEFEAENDGIGIPTTV